MSEEDALGSDELLSAFHARCKDYRESNDGRHPHQDRLIVVDSHLEPAQRLPTGTWRRLRSQIK